MSLIMNYSLDFLLPYWRCVPLHQLACQPALPQQLEPLPQVGTHRFIFSFKAHVQFTSFPVIFSGVGFIPPASAVNYIPWGIVGFIFQYVLRRRHFSWWAKYNYVLSAALDSGVAVAAVIIFFCLQYPKNGQIGIDTIQVWWGNT